MEHPSSLYRKSNNNSSARINNSGLVIIQEELGGNGDYEELNYNNSYNQNSTSVSFEGQGQQGDSSSINLGRVSTPISTTNSEQSIFHGTILESSILRDELEEKAIQIAKLKLELIEALRTQERLKCRFRRSSLESGCGESTRIDGSSNISHHDGIGFELEPSMMDDETLRGNTLTNLDGLDVSIRQGLVRWADTINRDQVVQTVSAGTLAASHFAIGDFAGWTMAYLIKKFGKVAVTAVGGGLIILQIAHHKGYIVVNWSNIFNELEQVAAADENEAIVGDWVANKIRSFKTWTKNNSYIVAGFLCGFMYKTFR